MRNILLAIVAVLVVSLFAVNDAQARLFGGRSNGGCNMGRVTAVQIAPAQATGADLQAIPAPKTVSIKPGMTPTRNENGLDIAQLAALNGNVPLGAAFQNVAAK